MDHVGASLLLFVSLCQLTMADLVGGLLTRMTIGASVYLVCFPALLSGAVALVVKYLIAMRILPIGKLVCGGLLALLVSWYIDRICKNNAYLLVRSVGLAIVFCAALGFVIVSDEGFADRNPRIEAQAAAPVDCAATGD